MRRLAHLLDMIKFEHTIFALPFALLSLFLAAEGVPRPGTLLWVLLAMVGARSSAMTMNRIADRRIDAENPRTQRRHLPLGIVRWRDAWIFTLAMAALFVFAASRLNRLALALSPVALAVTWAYSWSKRFTWGSHLWLGASLALAPLGAWIAVRGRLDVLPLVLGAGVVFWVAGFDVIYSLQDEDFDRAHGLFSLPARLGARRALAISTASAKRPLATFQNGVCGRCSRQKRCHRAIVPRSAPTSLASSRTRRGVGPCRMAAIKITRTPRYILRPRKRTDGGVALLRQPSRSQQKLSLCRYSSGKPSGQPRGFRG